jgi:hypothetical protein
MPPGAQRCCKNWDEAHRVDSRFSSPAWIYLACVKRKGINARSPSTALTRSIQTQMIIMLTLSDWIRWSASCGVWFGVVVGLLLQSVAPKNLFRPQRTGNDANITVDWKWI